MAPTMEQLSRHVTDWRASILDKGLKVNAGNTKLMVGISGGKKDTSLQKEMEKEYYEEEVQLYRKTHHKPIIYEH